MVGTPRKYPKNEALCFSRFQNGCGIELSASCITHRAEATLGTNELAPLLVGDLAW